MFAFIRALFRSAQVKGNVKLDDEEAAPLLDDDHSQETDQSSLDKPPPLYGSTDTIAVDRSGNAPLNSDDKSNSNQVNDKQEEVKSKVEEKHWFAYVRQFGIFLPYMWPSGNLRLQLHLIGMVICLVAIRFLNVLAPRQLGIVINSFGKSPGHLPVSELLLYCFFDWLTTSSVVGAVKDYLWLSLEQNAHEAIVTTTFNHIMGLSCNFHDNKNSGELYMAMRQGNSIYTLFESAFFDLLPMLVDLVVACVYLSYLFGSYMALLVGTTTIIYLASLKYSAAKQVDILRQTTEASRKEFQVMYGAMGSWISVAYFGNFDYEQERYKAAVALQLKMQLKFMILRYVARMLQASILKVGFVVATFMAAYQVSAGTITVGSFVLLLDYWSRFTGPLSIFYHFSRQLQQNLVEAEKLMELLREKPSVPDGPSTFEFRRGSVSFENVLFNYNGSKPTIRNLNFRAEPGQTIALVGATGSGKSTILKLLFRFYDVDEGSIRIDDQDIRDVTLASVHQHIGVVPQNPVLFNDTVMNNVRYSRLDATDAQVIEACKAAAVHDQITTFTNGYTTIVGENGVKLSGGEIQRIAIARAILKDPKIILLDEATSSVDTKTEHQIQTALRALTRGRTTFVVAHRLSTVVEADVMLVIKDGAIVEQGSPKDLLGAKGEFFELWSLQNIAQDFEGGGGGGGEGGREKGDEEEV